MPRTSIRTWCLVTAVLVTGLGAGSGRPARAEPIVLCGLSPAGLWQDLEGSSGSSPGGEAWSEPGLLSIGPSEWPELRADEPDPEPFPSRLGFASPIDAAYRLALRPGQERSGGTVSSRLLGTQIPALSGLRSHPDPGLKGFLVTAGDSRHPAPGVARLFRPPRA